MRTLLALGAMLMALVPISWGQVYDLTLYHTDPEALSPEARIHYDQAVESVDRIDYIAAVRQMGMAAEAAPDSPEIQSHFITLALRTVRPDSYSIEELLAISDQVLNAYDRILAQEDLPQYVRDFFARERGDFERLLDDIGQRIHRRRNVSRAYAQSYTAELRRVEEARERFRQRQAEMRRAQAADPLPPPETVRERGVRGESIEGNPLLPLRDD